CNKKYRCHAVKYCYCQHKHVSEKQFFVVMFKHIIPSRFFWICVRPSLYSIKKKKTLFSRLFFVYSLDFLKPSLIPIFLLFSQVLFTTHFLYISSLFIATYHFN